MVIHARNFVTSDDALGGSVIQRSVRFNSTDSTQIENTNLGTSPTSRRIATISFWFKRSRIQDSGMITMGYSGTGASAAGFAIRFKSSHQLGVENQVGNSLVWDIKPTRLFEDVSSWYHVVAAIDTTQGTSSNRVKVYVNGVQETDLETASYPSQNYDNLFNYNKVRIGAWDGNGYYNGFNGYIADFYSIDGQQLDASYFGYTDSQTGLWRPKRYEGTFGNNGHYLDFSDNSSASNLGLDRSGNSKDFNNVSNISVSSGDGNDSTTDTPTSNKATLNDITGFSNRATLDQGALQMTGSNGFKDISTIAIDGSSKFYYEATGGGGGWQLLGLFIGQPNNPSNALSNSAIWGFASTEALYQGGSYSSSGAPSWSNSDLMGIKYNDGTLQIYKNGTLWGTSITGVPTNDKIFAYIANDNVNASTYVRFNSDSWTEDSAAGVDDSWELSVKNVSPNVPSIVRPKRHFDTILYTGNGATSARAITGFEFAPDLVWLKNRDSTYHHQIHDTVRGTSGGVLYPNQTSVEDPIYSLSSFDSNGFSIAKDANQAGQNNNGDDYVAWCWKAGGTAVSNTDGSITAQVSANTEAGFSIMTWTGNGYISGSTIGHGLGKAPKMIWIKRRNISTDNWAIYFNDGTKRISSFFNTSAPIDPAQASYWPNNDPTSSVFYVGTDSAVNGSVSMTYVGYAWAEIPGYSKFGTYSGNNANDGTYVHLGFRPVWLMVKRIDSTRDFLIYDAVRSTFNPIQDFLEPNQSTVEQSANANKVNFLSNGFKFRNNSGDMNGAGTYFYMAFAEQSGDTVFKDQVFPNAR